MKFASEVKLRRELDCFAIGILVIAILVRVLTGAFLVNVNEIAQTNFTHVVAVMEANPLARWAISMNTFKLILGTVIIPGSMFGLYWFMRKKVPVRILEPSIIVLFFIMLFNLANDFGLWLGLQLRTA